MGTEIIHADLPSRHFEPHIYRVGAWTDHLYFAYDLVAPLKPRVMAELGVDRGESYFAFCQSVVENKTGTRCFEIDAWHGDQHARGHDESTFAQVFVHNRANYGTFSTLMRTSFDSALETFAPTSSDILRIDNFRSAAALRHVVESRLPKGQLGGAILRKKRRFPPARRPCI